MKTKQSYPSARAVPDRIITKPIASFRRKRSNRPAQRRPTGAYFVSGSSSSFGFGFGFEQPATHLDPKGAAQGCAAFSDRARDGESENPLYFSGRGIGLSRKALSFGYFSLGQQRKVTRPRQRTEALAVASKHSQRQRQEQSPWIPAYAGMTVGVSRPRRRTEALAVAFEHLQRQRQNQSPWIPACAGMTARVTIHTRLDPPDHLNSRPKETQPTTP